MVVAVIKVIVMEVVVVAIVVEVDCGVPGLGKVT